MPILRMVASTIVAASIICTFLPPALVDMKAPNPSQ